MSRSYGTIIKKKKMLVDFRKNAKDIKDSADSANASVSWRF